MVEMADVVELGGLFAGYELHAQLRTEVALPL